MPYSAVRRYLEKEIENDPTNSFTLFVQFNEPNDDFTVFMYFRSGERWEVTAKTLASAMNTLGRELERKQYGGGSRGV